MLNFLEYGLDERIIKALEEMKITSPTSIQEMAIPHALAGADLIASAQTGTGKTAAFLLPGLQLLLAQTKVGKGPRFLILVPTRELATQVFGEIKKLTKYLPQIKTACIYGGVPYHAQRKALKGPCDIVVATPGRLIDHMGQGLLNLSHIKLFVLDEADRMLDMGFVDSIKQVAAATPKERQTLLFSATIDRKILPISKALLNNPHEIQAVGHQTDKSSIEKFLYYVDNIGHKTRLLEHILEHTKIYQTILFTSTKRQADTLSLHLKQRGYESSALHGDMSQRQRNRTIERMRKGDFQVLVATDVAGRGIDIPAITHVINFDLPRNPEDFVHRIGRTGRAGASGTAISFATYQEQPWVTKINQLFNEPMQLQTVDGMEPRAKTNKGREDHKNPRRRKFVHTKPGKLKSFGRPRR